MSAIHPTAPPDVYRKRRGKLAAALTRPFIIFAGKGRARNYPANTYPFRAASNYLYFGGPPVEGAALLIEPGADPESGCVLFRPATSLDDSVWTGEPIADQQLADAAGISPRNVRDADKLSAAIGGRKVRALVPSCLETARWAESLKLSPADTDEMLPIIDLRLVKDEHELRAMRRAAEVSVQAHTAAMQVASPGATESDILAAYWSVLHRHRCDGSFSPIATVHGEILHPGSSANVMRDGQLLLLDAGAEEPGGYACDITRTMPVNGSFTSIQRQLYDTVVRAVRAAITACVPGRRYRDIHDLAASVICEGLVDAGLLRGNVNDLAARRAHTLFFVHGLGHLIGLDVHDMEDFWDLAGYAPGRVRRTQFGDKFLRLDRDLVSGMTFTIEPGIYLVPAIWRHAELVERFKDVVNRDAVEKLLAMGFGGIRVEDTVHVRSTAGPEVLTEALPKDADSVAALARR